MHEALVEEAPLAGEVSVVGSVKDSGIVENPFLLEVIEDAADVFVDGDETGVIILGHAFE